MKLSVGAALVGTLALLATACSGPAGEGSGGTLIIGSTQIPRHLNPAVQSGLATAIPGAQLFASPVRFDSDFEPKPYLAERWDIADDSKQVTLHLVEGATFHDGQPITSADVAFSIDVVKENHPFGADMWGPLASVETPDEQTVVINLKDPHPAIMLAMSPALLPVLPEHVYGDGQDITAHPNNTRNVVGSGPFRLAEHVEGQRIVLERHEDFFIEGAPALDRMAISFFPGAQQLSLALERGEVQYSLVTDPAILERLAGSTDLQVHERGGEGLGSINWLEFNTKNEILDDVRVRQAIAYAIDKKFLRDDLLKGYSARTPSPIHPEVPFYNADVNTYERDLAKAASLLDAAGYSEKAGGTRFSLTIDYLPGADAYQKNVAESIKAQLAELGITVKVRSAPDFPTWSKRVSNYDFDLSMDNVWNWGDPIIGVQRNYLCDNITKGVVWSNMTRYCNERVDELLGKAALEVDEDKRAALYSEFQEIVVDEVPIHFLSELTFRAVTATSVQNPPLGIWGPMSPMLQTSVEG